MIFQRTCVCTIQTVVFGLWWLRALQPGFRTIGTVRMCIVTLIVVSKLLTSGMSIRVLTRCFLDLHRSQAVLCLLRGFPLTSVDVLLWVGTSAWRDDIPAV